MLLYSRDKINYQALLNFVPDDVHIINKSTIVLKLKIVYLFQFSGIICKDLDSMSMTIFKTPVEKDCFFHTEIQ